MGELIISLPSDAGLREQVEAALADTARAEAHQAGVQILDWDLDGPPPAPHIDIVVPPYWGGAPRLARLAEVDCQLVQWQSIGVNGLGEYVPAGVPVANAATVHEPSTAELALGLTIAMQRAIPEYVRAADRHEWMPGTRPSLADRRVLLLGYGGVGKAIEARLLPFEVQLTRVASTARTEHDSTGTAVEVRGIDELPQLLPEADIVIIGLPLSPATEQLFDAAMLARMADDALLVNVGRGPIVDTAALVAELTSGRIRAALDVVDPEPLPAEHPLWGCPNVLISPHVGGDSTAMLPRVAALLTRQIARLRAGETPENLVNLS